MNQQHATVADALRGAVTIGGDRHRGQTPIFDCCRNAVEGVAAAAAAQPDNVPPADPAGRINWVNRLADEAAPGLRQAHRCCQTLLVDLAVDLPEIMIMNEEEEGAAVV